MSETGSIDDWAAKLSSKSPPLATQLILLVLLVAMLAGCVAIILAVPHAYVFQKMGSAVSGNKRFALFFYEARYENPIRTQFESITIDLESGRARTAAIPLGDSLAACIDDDWNLYLLRHPQDRRGQINRDRVQLVILDSATSQVRFFDDVDFPPAQRMRLAGGHYLVAPHDLRIHVLDIDNVAAGTKSIPHQTQDAAYVEGVRDRKRFYVVEFLTQQGTSQSAGVPTIHMFAINQQGVPEKITSWPAGVIDQWTAAEHSPRHLFSLSVDLSHVEIRSMDDGRLMSRIPIPVGVDVGKGGLGFVLGTVIAEDFAPYRYYDLEDQEWLPTPEGGYRLYNISPDRRYVYYCCQKSSQRQFVIYDRLRAEYGPPFLVANSAAVYRDDDRLIATSDRYGYSVRFMDARTGKTIREITPLAWTVRLTIVILVLHVIWSAAWMIVSARQGGWAWIDTVLVMGTPALALLLRFALMGDAYDLDRIPTRQALGCVMAAMMMAVIWIVFGKTRLSLRVMPMLVLVALAMGLFALVFREKSWVAWYALTCAIAPAACLAVLLIPLRLFGWQLDRRYARQSVGEARRTTANSPPSGEGSYARQSVEHEALSNHTDRSPPSGEGSYAAKGGMTSSLGRSRYPLRDLVLLTVVAAMLFAAIRPVLDGIGQVLHMDAFLMTPLVVALGLGCAALVSAMHPRQWWFYAGAVFTMAGLVWVAADPMLEFASGGYRSRNVDPLRLHAALVCGVALFTGLIPYRLRGWTLARRSRRHA